MSAPPPSSGISAAMHAVLDSPRFSAVLASTIMGTVVFGHAIRSVLGWPGFIAALALLGLLAVGVLLQRRDQFEWQGILPISLLAFVGWCALSVIWSQYQWASLSGVIYQIGVALLAVFVAIGRDLIQIVRGLGDVLRVALGASVAVEILSGIILDTPFAFLGITGSLANGGPIQGVFGSRNLLGLVCLIAAITFAVELATKSIPRNLGVASLLLTVAVFGLTRSPVGGFIAAGAGVAAVALTSLRRTDPDTRRRLQIAFAALAVLGGLTAYLARARIVDLFNAGGELSLRLSLWTETANLTSANSIEGWGWVGTWRSELLPFLVLRTANGRVPTSALNAYLDVWFQLGLVGLVIFVAFLGLALTRAWIVASNRRNVAHVWPALILVAVAVASMAESSALVEIGWFLLVVCAVKAAQELSWRSGLR